MVLPNVRMDICRKKIHWIVRAGTGTQRSSGISTLEDLTLFDPWVWLHEAMADLTCSALGITFALRKEVGLATFQPTFL